MKRLPAILILIIIFLNVAGFYVYYALHLIQIKREMREALKVLPESELDVLILTHPQFQEARVEDHEIKVNGKMYDIARIHEEGEILIIYCKHDEKEDNLIAFMDHVFSVPIAGDDQLPNAINEFILMSFVKPSALIISVSRNEVKEAFTVYRFIPKTFSYSPETPPPWSFLDHDQLSK